MDICCCCCCCRHRPLLRLKCLTTYSVKRNFSQVKMRLRGGRRVRGRGPRRRARPEDGYGYGYGPPIPRTYLYPNILGTEAEATCVPTYIHTYRTYVVIKKTPQLASGPVDHVMTFSFFFSFCFLFVFFSFVSSYAHPLLLATAFFFPCASWGVGVIRREEKRMGFTCYLRRPRGVGRRTAAGHKKCHEMKKEEYQITQKVAGVVVLESTAVGNVGICARSPWDGIFSSKENEEGRV